MKKAKLGNDALTPEEIRVLSCFAKLREFALVCLVVYLAVLVQSGVFLGF